MQNKPSEEKLARAAYNWLRVSPIVTITTLFIVANIGFGYFICGNNIFSCSYEDISYVNSGIGILVSALWHLLLLQYVNNKDSEFVRKHGTRALTYAGIRTAIAFAGVLLDYFSGAGGSLACVTIIVLLILWFAQTNAGMQNIKRELESNPDISRDAVFQQFNTQMIQPRIYLTDENREETLNQILDDLQSKDDVAVLKAIMKLNEVQESNEGILKKIEFLADEHTSKDVRMDARVILNMLKQNNQVISTEVNMAKNESRSSLDILNEILSNLKSKEDEQIVKAFAELKKINYSSEAIRRQVEKISISSSNSKVRDEAREVLNLSAHQAVQKSSSTLDRGIRYTILNEIKKWVNDGLLEKENADVIQSRYDFDFVQTITETPQTKPVPASVPVGVAQPVAPRKPAEPATPRPSLLQTLTSEASVKIYLYLGAFFVIAAASIFAAAIPELRLPLLIIGTFIFGGLALVIKKRLPQPSFALFIVFSFLLLITANSLEESLRDTFKYSDLFTDGYWVAISLIMAVIWGGGTRLYESRFLSIVAFGSFAVALLRIGIVFATVSEFYSLMLAIAALSGLAGVWLLRKWKDANFAMPLFLATQLTQAIALVVSISVFTINVFDPSNVSLWHLIGFFVWGFAGAYYIVSDKLYPFLAFVWLTAATLIPMPWFIAAAFDMESLGSTILLFVWGAILAIASEALNRIETTRKYSLPMLIASMPAFGLSLVTGFAYENWLALVTSFGIAVIFTVLHILRTRWWLWSLALINFIIAYFVFFNLNFIQALNIFIGYQLVGVSILCLISDLFLKKDWGAQPEQRLPLRIFGVVLSISTVAVLITQNASIHIAICFASFTLFSAIYSIAYQKSWLAYIPAALLPIAIIYALDYFNSTVWLPILTALTFLYFLFGIAIRSKESWAFVLRNSALILGSIISFVALIDSGQASGWYVFAIGLLFVAEMVLRKNGAFEIGAPILFSIAAFLLMQDFEVNNTSTQLLVHSIIWILADLLAHLTFKHPRPLSIIIRGIGGFIAIINYGYLFGEPDSIAATGFAIYTLLFLTVSLLYRNPTLFYAFTLTLPLFVTFLFRSFDFTKWIHPVIVLAIFYYAAGFLLRASKRASGWDLTLLYSALGLGVFVSIAAPIIGGVDAAIPVAVAGTLWAVEAFLKRNAWLAFPANGLYLMAYFILLNELNVNQPQFFSIGAALLGLLQHYLLTRAGSKAGAFIMGMISQFILVGTTYLQMLSEGELIYFFVLFLQSLAVLVYGIIIRSRSLTFFPIGFVVIGVMTVVLGQLQELGTILVIGCAGVLLLVLGIGAVLLRERITKLSEKLSDWQA